jgi:hypothetical protein
MFFAPRAAPLFFSSPPDRQLFIATRPTTLHQLKRLCRLSEHQTGSPQSCSRALPEGSAQRASRETGKTALSVRATIKRR